MKSITAVESDGFSAAQPLTGYGGPAAYSDQPITYETLTENERRHALSRAAGAQRMKVNCPGLNETEEDGLAAHDPGLFVRGAIQAGVWRDALEWPESDWQHLPPEPRWRKCTPSLETFGLVVEGPSMNLIFPPGSVLVCARYADLGAGPLNGDYVICQRRLATGLVEATVKELRRTTSGWWLHPRSDHPAHQEPILLAPPSQADTSRRVSEFTANEAECIHIPARVLGAYHTE